MNYDLFLLRTKNLLLDIEGSVIVLLLHLLK